jgi:hypothetical protein
MKIKYDILTSALSCCVVHPQVAAGGNGPWIWRVVVNILNKQLCTATVLQSVAYGLGLQWIFLEWLKLWKMDLDLGYGM